MWYARIQDDRFPTPAISNNWRREQDEAFIDLFGEGSKLPETMNGLSVFVDLRWAVKDLLGRCSADGENPCYAAAIEEDGGVPVLALIDGEAVADDIGAATVIEPDLATERRFAPDDVWTMLLEVLAITLPEDEDELLSWERTPEGFKRLWAEYDLGTAEALELVWPAVEERLMVYCRQP